MKHIYLLAITLLLPFFQYSQNWLLSQQGVSSSTAIESRQIASDNFGNVYVLGYYNAATSISGTPLTLYGARDIFLSKYNNNGVLQWVVSAGSATADNAYGLTLDAAGIFM
jgi:hypothetical protein